MSRQNKRSSLTDAIPSTAGDPLEALAKNVFADQMLHEATRKRVNQIIDEHIGSVKFMKKIREYASMEIDSRMFTSTKYWGAVIITALVTSLIGLLIGRIGR